MKKYLHYIAVLFVCLSASGCASVSSGGGQLVVTERNPIEGIADDVDRIEWSALYGRQKHPNISAGISNLFVTVESEAVKEVVSHLQAIEDGTAVVPGSGFIVRLNLFNKEDMLLARVSVMWDAKSVVIVDAEGRQFARRNKQFPMFCFDALVRNAPSYLHELLDEKRPCPPVSFMIERFPFEKLQK
jgi:hypothetical protein